MSSWEERLAEALELSPRSKFQLLSRSPQFVKETITSNGHEITKLEALRSSRMKANPTFVLPKAQLGRAFKLSLDDLKTSFKKIEKRIEKAQKNTNPRKISEEFSDEGEEKPFQFPHVNAPRVKNRSKHEERARTLKQKVENQSFDYRNQRDFPKTNFENEASFAKENEMLEENFEEDSTQQELTKINQIFAFLEEATRCVKHTHEDHNVA